MRGSLNSLAYATLLSARTRREDREAEVEKERQRKQMVLGVGLLVVVTLGVAAGASTLSNFMEYQRSTYAARIIDHVLPHFT